MPGKGPFGGTDRSEFARPGAARMGGFAVYVACSTLCFASHSLSDAFRIIREMHFSKVDLTINRNGPHLTPEDVFADVSKTATQLKASNLAFAALHVGACEEEEPRPDHFRAICRLARLLAVPTVTVVPTDTSLDATVHRLRPLAKSAASEGVELTVETNVRGMTGEPAAAVELCHRLPGIGLTLDPSYFLTAGLESKMDSLYPFISHVRLRDSGKKPEEFQVRVGQGEVDYGRIIAMLEREGYDRTLSVDIRDIPDSPFPVDAEVRKLKYLLESLIS
jgi:sugar phosphate isomerase/epimerase